MHIVIALLVIAICCAVAAVVVIGVAVIYMYQGIRWLIRKYKEKHRTIEPAKPAKTQHQGSAEFELRQRRHYLELKARCEAIMSEGGSGTSEGVKEQSYLEEQRAKETEFTRKSREHYEQLKKRCAAIKAKGKTLKAKGKTLDGKPSGPYKVQFSHLNVKAELLEFKNTIYHVKLLGHEDKRFTEVALKAHNIITEYGTSPCFYDEVEEALSHRKNFESEVIVYIIRQKRKGDSDTDLIKKIRRKYIKHREEVQVKPAKPSTPAKHVAHQVSYVEVEVTKASEARRAKAKIAHKHRAIQYANIIGGDLAEEYEKGSYDSFYKFLKAKCEGMASKGEFSLTSEELISIGDVIVEYKRALNGEKDSSVKANVVVPQHKSDNKKVNDLLTVLNRLTDMKLPRFETPRSSTGNEWYQREYAKTNPFDIYNDLVESEYGQAAFKDKRFSVLYQLILFAAGCLDCGMTVEETLTAISSLKVVRKNDLKILRQMAARYNGLSKQEKQLVKECEELGVLSITDLYIDLIRHYKASKQSVTLNQYIIAVLMRQRKESYAGWCLLKYICVKESGKSNAFIQSHRLNITLCTFYPENTLPLKAVNDHYYPLEVAFNQLRNQFVAGKGMIRYNCERDGITKDMLTPSTFNRYIPKRFDSKGRFIAHVSIDIDEVDLFKDFDQRMVGESLYVLLPIHAFSTEDIYQHLLTCKKQMKR